MALLRQPIMTAMFVAMTYSPEMTRLQARRKVVDEEIGNHRIALAELEKEARELEIAERVFLRFSQAADVDGHDADVTPPPAATGNDDIGKPADTPTIPEMILESLHVAEEQQGMPGLEPSGMLSYVRGRWWPDAPAASIGPIAWRMWKRGDLIKEGTIYRLPKSSAQAETGAVAAPAPSLNLQEV